MHVTILSQYFISLIARIAYEMQVKFYCWHTFEWQSHYAILTISNRNRLAHESLQRIRSSLCEMCLTFLEWLCRRIKWICTSFYAAFFLNQHSSIAIPYSQRHKFSLDPPSQSKQRASMKNIHLNSNRRTSNIYKHYMVVVSSAVAG